MNEYYPYHVSFVLATHNRREVIGDTLSRIETCGLDRSAFEIIVVDNASTDGTPELIADRCDHLLRLRRNAGSCAKADGVRRATGHYLVFLDDDSHPRPGSVAQMMSHFEADPKLGAAGFTIHLPDGRQEGSALPDVFVGCGVGFRAEALRACGGLDRSFFMQAEEYDLAFRLVESGWEVRLFDELHVDHLKTQRARRSARITYYDIRNNLRVAARYLPANAYRVYKADWLQRYAWLADREGHASVCAAGGRAGRWRGAIERLTHRSHRFGPAIFERFFRWHYVKSKMARLASKGITAITLIDLGKNIYPFYRAARDTGINILAIGDDRFAGPQHQYRRIPVVPVETALGGKADAIVVANCSMVHGTASYLDVVKRTTKPVHHWFGRETEVDSAPASRDARRIAEPTNTEQPMAATAQEELIDR